MGENLPEWNLLDENPDPFKLKAAGYEYLYVDLKYLNKYANTIQKNCVELIDKIQDKNAGTVVDGRYLFNLTKCQ